MEERLLIDTNVFVAAVRSRGGGASRDVLRLCLQGDYNPVVGQKLVAEYEDVFSRAAPFKHSPLSKHERDEVMDAFLSVSIWVPVFFLWRPNLPDEGDNHLIELAVAGGATKLITHNARDFRSRDLLFPNLAIMTPAELLRIRRNKDGNDDDSNS